ncbi:ComEA family DNA-binding protein [Mycolicibacterium thermoresistibile]|uniref:Helix-hairpin-helix repeat-containing competence protein ComEA n=2 Tax=Mycolicibacterium thermoresistibile TaxID=1797 RepID=G7CIV1_MYCT3|nr:ComEA family DNA-binding protein [Mycolicibacterium thermoresistibile]EHI12630.1 helix-hairpin-helix repeat-containing competence protein ComEA [Mycolicibacterium thermoresistibile ATCC 19527]MCV7190109.1 ComEA family DNA-binding protein [Mycolicibacterium thermoresistibile]GAT13834.1 helix-hairpin-helix repeat-containing competence protein ComEA [Mycolicibacterium thermoresistibile]SNW19007.1 competence protein ComEA-like protein with helix-hairpin-helix repeat region [Mycolicibacterium the
MRTELPAARLYRRLGAGHHPDSGSGRTDTGEDRGEDRGEERGEDRGEEGTAANESGTAPDAVLSKWLPDNTDGASGGWLAAIRADPGRAGAVALVAVGVTAVLITIFALVRDETPPVMSANLPPVEMVSSASAAPGPQTTAAPDEPVVVSVVGLVHKPGLVRLAPGARVADALTAAGGAVGGADLIGLNMARRVTDGEQIIVGIAAVPGEPAALGSSISTGAGDPAGAPASGAGESTAPDPGGAAGGSVNLNTATVEQLDTLPGIGPVTAEAIVAWRDRNGRFDSVDQLLEVDGIGPARLDKLRDRVHV